VQSAKWSFIDGASCTTLLRGPMQQSFSPMAFGSLEIAEIVEFLEGVEVPASTPPGVEAKIESAVKKLEKAVDFLDAGKEEEAEELLEAALAQLNETISQVDSLKCSVKKGRCILKEKADALIADLETACSMIENISEPTLTKMYVVNYKNNTISQANLDGTGGMSLGNLNGTLNKPEHIALGCPVSEWC
jgi:uncharacterized protein YicC (UPF0701 family)